MDSTSAIMFIWFLVLAVVSTMLTQYMWNLGPIWSSIVGVVVGLTGMMLTAFVLSSIGTQDKK